MAAECTQGCFSFSHSSPPPYFAQPNFCSSFPILAPNAKRISVSPSPTFTTSENHPLFRLSIRCPRFKRVSKSTPSSFASSSHSARVIPSFLRFASIAPPPGPMQTPRRIHCPTYILSILSEPQRYENEPECSSAACLSHSLISAALMYIILLYGTTHEFSLFHVYISMYKEIRY